MLYNIFKPKLYILTAKCKKYYHWVYIVYLYTLYITTVYCLCSMVLFRKILGMFAILTSKIPTKSNWLSETALKIESLSFLLQQKSDDTHKS